MKKSFLMVAMTLVVSAVVSCSDDEVEDPNVKTWDMTVEAVMENGTEDGTRTDATAEDIFHDFSTEDRIYIYNFTKRSLFDGNLKPVTGGRSITTLMPDGKLKGIAEVGDELYLTYAPFNWKPENLLYILKGRGYNPWFDGYLHFYGTMDYYQTGLQSEILNFDYAESRVKVESIDGDTILVKGGKANFTRLQSIFHLTFRFEDEYGNEVDTKDFDLVGEGRTGKQGYMQVFYLNSEGKELHMKTGIYKVMQQFIQSGETHMALAFKTFGKDVASQLCFTVRDANKGVIYNGFLNAPEGTFHNGKIYVPTEPIVMKEETD